MSEYTDKLYNDYANELAKNERLERELSQLKSNLLSTRKVAEAMMINLDRHAHDKSCIGPGDKCSCWVRGELEMAKELLK